MDPASDRVALLVIRVWIEAGSDPPAMKARLVAIPDLADRRAPQLVSAAARIDEVCEQVRRWLTTFLGADGTIALRPEHPPQP